MRSRLSVLTKRVYTEPTMEEKRAFPPSNAGIGTGFQKRKDNALNSSTSSSTPSKGITRDKALPPHTPPFHNGPLTRARQIPTATSAPASAAVKHSKQAPDTVALAEELNRESEWEALETAIEAQIEAVRSRDSNAHVVPTHCGWFSWTNIHLIEKRMLPSFFNGKIENWTPDTWRRHGIIF